MGKLRYSEFKHRLDIDRFEEAIGFEVLRHDRGNDVGTCLFPENHQNGDSTGKFAIHREKMVYNCWVCDGGDLLSLTMELYDWDVDEATAWLYQFTGGDSSRSDTEFRDYLLEILADVEERSATMPYFNERVLERFSTECPEMFAERGISEEVAREYHLSYANPTIKSAPVKHTGEEIQKIDDDYYGPALIFPHFWKERLVGWQSRWLDWDEEQSRVPRWLPKYTNTTDFPKHNTLFNYDRALKIKQRNQPVVVVESVPTALFLISNGYPAVSYFGGDKMKDAQLRLLRRFQDGVILAPDNDKTGERFVRSGVQYLERFIPVYVADKVDLGPKSDLGDYAKTDNPHDNLVTHMTQHVHLAGVEF